MRVEETTHTETSHHTPEGAVIGCSRELELLRAAMTAGRDVLLEGPPGTSKTTMLRAITGEWGVPLMFVQGNADLTTSKLVGHHAPDRVLREGYRAENFVDGPLVEAMRQGGFLYIEELNRSPQDTLNTLLSAIGDRRLTVSSDRHDHRAADVQADRVHEPVRQRGDDAHLDEHL